MSGLFGGLVQWVIDTIRSMGYIGVGFLVALENLFPPIPSEVILPLTGFLVGRGTFSFPLALLAATIGSVAGALVLYGIGRWFSENRVRELAKTYGKFVMLRESDIDKGVRWFNDHGGSAVFTGRLVPGVRSVISIPAVIECMPVWKFVAYTAAGSALWNGILIALGWIVGDQWRTVSEYVGYLSYVVIALLVIAAGWFVYKRTQEEGEPERQRASDCG